MTDKRTCDLLNPVKVEGKQKDVYQYLQAVTGTGYGMQYHPDGFVLFADSTSLCKYDPMTGLITTLGTVAGGTITSIAIASFGRLCYVSDNVGNVYWYLFSTGAWAAVTDVGGFLTDPINYIVTLSDGAIDAIALGDNGNFVTLSNGFTTTDYSDAALGDFRTGAYDEINDKVIAVSVPIAGVGGGVFLYDGILTFVPQKVTPIPVVFQSEIMYAQYWPLFEKFYICGAWGIYVYDPDTGGLSYIYGSNWKFPAIALDTDRLRIYAISSTDQYLHIIELDDKERIISTRRVEIGNHAFLACVLDNNAVNLYMLSSGNLKVFNPNLPLAIMGYPTMPVYTAPGLSGGIPIAQEVIVRDSVVQTRKQHVAAGRSFVKNDPIVTYEDIDEGNSVLTGFVSTDTIEALFDGEGTGITPAAAADNFDLYFKRNPITNRVRVIVEVGAAGAGIFTLYAAEAGGIDLGQARVDVSLFGQGIHTIDVFFGQYGVLSELQVQYDGVTLPADHKISRIEIPQMEDTGGRKRTAHPFPDETITDFTFPAVYTSLVDEDGPVYGFGLTPTNNTADYLAEWVGDHGTRPPMSDRIDIELYIPAAGTGIFQCTVLDQEGQTLGDTWVDISEYISGHVIVPVYLNNGGPIRSIEIQYDGVAVPTNHSITGIRIRTIIPTESVQLDASKLQMAPMARLGASDLQPTSFSSDVPRLADIVTRQATQGIFAEIAATVVDLEIPLVLRVPSVVQQIFIEASANLGDGTDTYYIEFEQVDGTVTTVILPAADMFFYELHLEALLNKVTFYTLLAGGDYIAQLDVFTPVGKTPTRVAAQFKDGVFFTAEEIRDALDHTSGWIDIRSKWNKTIHMVSTLSVDCDYTVEAASDELQTFVEELGTGTITAGATSVETLTDAWHWVRLILNAPTAGGGTTGQVDALLNAN